MPQIIPNTPSREDMEAFYRFTAQILASLLNDNKHLLEAGQGIRFQWPVASTTEWQRIWNTYSWKFLAPLQGSGYLVKSENVGGNVTFEISLGEKLAGKPLPMQDFVQFKPSVNN